MKAFEILGLPEDADQQQVRQAYHALVKACHPDQFPDGEAQKKAQEELIRLNLAYEEALRLSAGRVPHYQVPGEEAKALARKLLEQGRYESALLQLSRTEERDDEWYFLQGEVLMAMRQFASAHQAYREAIRQDPENNEYRRGALEAALQVKKHQRLPYRVMDWADGVLHPRRKM